ncbi:RDD family protein [Verrucomicrobiota bacterium]
MIARESKLVIRTPEGICFPLMLASPISRFLALIIDTMVVTALSGVLGVVLRYFGILGVDFAMAFTMLTGFILSIGYPMVMEWYFRGQTVGKKALRLRVMDEQGLRLQVSQVVIRNLLRFIDSLPGFYLVGGVSSVVSPRSQRLGDIAANTIVVHHPKVEEPNLDQILPGKYNSFREYPHLAARLRQNVGPREAAVALEALTRRDSLEGDARLALFEKIKEHMGGAAKFPAEATDGISAEQYVRNVVDILFRPR